MVLGCKERNGYRFVDLFCGAGGATEGMKQAGFTLIRACDIDPVCVETYSANHGLGTASVSDLIQADPTCPWYSPADVLWASPPCTHHSRGYAKRKDYSVFDRLAKGMPPQDAELDPENAAMFVVPKFAAAHRYPYVVVENVPEVQKWPLFSIWVEQMRDLGYEHLPQILNAAKVEYPVPQTRLRYFGIFKQQGFPAPKPVPQSSRVPGVGTILEPDMGGVITLRDRPLAETTMTRIRNTVEAFPDSTRWVVPYYTGRKKGGSISLPVGTLTKRIRHCVITKTDAGLCFRMLALREQARLMGFHDDYQFAKQGKVLAEHQIGNAVCVNVARAVGISIAEALNASSG